jgi:phage terminase large subunit-like protein
LRRRRARQARDAPRPLRGRVAGIDGGGLDDLLGLCLAGREKRTKRWLYWFRAWAWKDVLKLRKEIAPRLLDFAKAGDLILLEPPEFDGSTADPTRRAREVPAQSGRGYRPGRRDPPQGEGYGLFPDKGAIGLDPQGVGALVDALAAIGLEHPQVVAIGQGFRLSSAVWSLERKLKHRTAAHSGSEMMAWCVSNAKAEQKGNAVVITKETAGKAKIDPLIAGFNATKLLEANPEAAGDKRPYADGRELLMVG